MSGDTTTAVTESSTRGTDHVVELAGVDSGYGEVQVLDDCSLHLDAEEIVCLIGPNGAGKSTVLKTVFGMLTPWEGSVTYPFARALVMEPDVLLIDEPSAGLAPNTAKDVFGHVEAVNDLDTAILMVEQNAKEGLGISDRGYVLDQGTVRFEGDADTLLDNEEVSKLYLGG